MTIEITKCQLDHRKEKSNTVVFQSFLKQIGEAELETAAKKHIIKSNQKNRNKLLQIKQFVAEYLKYHPSVTSKV